MQNYLNRIPNYVMLGEEFNSNQQTKTFRYVSINLRSHINNSSSCLTEISKHSKTMCEDTCASRSCFHTLFSRVWISRWNTRSRCSYITSKFLSKHCIKRVYLQKDFSQSADTKQHIKNDKFSLWSIIWINLSQGKVEDFSVEVQDDAHISFSFYLKTTTTVCFIRIGIIWGRLKSD
jgi:hypothetical protein